MLLQESFFPVKKEIIHAWQEQQAIIGTQSSAILAGHNILNSFGQLSTDLGVFPEETWELARELISMNTRSQLFTTINDWSMTGNFSGNKAALREKFWESFRLEDIYNLTGIENNLYPYGRGSHGKTDMRGIFSEQALQQRYNHHIKKQVPHIHTYFGEKVCEGGCDINRCASELVVMVPELYHNKIRSLLLFAPSKCLEPVSYALAILRRETKALFSENMEAMQIIMVFLNSENPQSTEELYDSTKFGITKTVLK